MVLPDATCAFQAYRLLQHYGMSPEHLAIVGQGYSSPDRVGLLEPMQIARRKARDLAIAAGTLGSAIGLSLFLASIEALSTSVNFKLLIFIPVAGIIGGFLGAVLGALFGFFGEGSTAGIYHHHLKQGRYLLMMEGPEKLVRWGQEVLNQYSAPKPR
jgi:hypothetical protein